MDDDEQVAAYAEAGRIDGVMAAAYLLHSARICQIVRGASFVIDLACGPATQLAQIAALNPQVEFLGVDLSDRMLASARRHIAALGLPNVSFINADITRLGFLRDGAADAVISTMALHHLPTIDHLARCFAEVRRVLRAGGGLYLVDFGRLKSLKSVLFFAYMNAKRQPHLFSLDYERSLRAAFRYEELRELAARELPSAVRIYSTFIAPLLVVLQTAPAELNEALAARLRRMRAELPRRYRTDLDQLRMFLRMGGLPADPFG